MSDECSSKHPPKTGQKRKIPIDQEEIWEDMLDGEDAVKRVARMKAVEAEMKANQANKEMDIREVNEEMKSGSDHDDSEDDEIQLGLPRWDAEKRKYTRKQICVWVANGPWTEQHDISFLRSHCKVHCHWQQDKHGKVSYSTCNLGSKCRNPTALNAIYVEPPREKMEDPDEYNPCQIDGKTKQSIWTYVKKLLNGGSFEWVLVPVSALRWASGLSNTEVQKHVTTTTYGQRAFQNKLEDKRGKQKEETKKALAAQSAHKNPFGLIGKSGPNGWINTGLISSYWVVAAPDGDIAYHYPILLLGLKIKNTGLSGVGLHLCVYFEFDRELTTDQISTFFRKLEDLPGLFVRHVSTEEEDEENGVTCCRTTMEPIHHKSDSELSAASDDDEVQANGGRHEDGTGLQVMQRTETKSTALITMMQNPTDLQRTSGYSAAVRCVVGVAVCGMSYKDENEKTVYLRNQKGNTSKEVMQAINKIVNRRADDNDKNGFYQLSACDELLELRTKMVETLTLEPSKIETEPLEFNKPTGLELMVLPADLLTVRYLEENLTVMELKMIHTQLQFNMHGRTKKAELISNLRDKATEHQDVAQNILNCVEQFITKHRDKRARRTEASRCRGGEKSSASESEKSSDFSTSDEEDSNSDDEDHNPGDQNTIRRQALLHADRFELLAKAFRAPTREIFSQAMKALEEMRDPEKMKHNLEQMRTLNRGTRQRQERLAKQQERSAKQNKKTRKGAVRSQRP